MLSIDFQLCAVGCGIFKSLFVRASASARDNNTIEVIGCLNSMSLEGPESEMRVGH